MLISVHTPKAGGTSFKALLESHYGKGFLPDYGDMPLNKTPDERNADAARFRRKFNVMARTIYRLKGVRCIHGHFLPYKYGAYIQCKKVPFVTWLRDPAERLASHYHFWFRVYNEKKAFPLHKRVVEENWSFEKFCFSEEMRNIYAKFFWEFPVERFDFIGITEYYDEDVRYFAGRFLGSRVENIPKVNVNEDRGETYYHDKAFLEKLKAFHLRDYEIYNYALRKREGRL